MYPVYKSPAVYPKILTDPKNLSRLFAPNLYAQWLLIFFEGLKLKLNVYINPDCLTPRSALAGHQHVHKRLRKYLDCAMFDILIVQNVEIYPKLHFFYFFFFFFWWKALVQCWTLMIVYVVEKRTRGYQNTACITILIVLPLKYYTLEHKTS